MRRAPSSRQSRWLDLGFAASLACMALLVALTWSPLIDDTYIFLRYAANLAAGRGYVFNPGELVEGATSVTWTLLLAASAALHLPLTLAARGLAFGCLALTLCALWATFRRAATPAPAALFVLALLICDPNFSASIMLGLETGLFALLLVVFAWLAGEARDDGRQGAAFGVVGLLLFLTRPEAIALLGAALLGLAALRPGGPRFARAAAVVLVVGMAATFGARLLLFGDLLPNSVRAKSALGLMLTSPTALWARLAAGATYLRAWAFASPLLVGVGLMAMGTVAARRPFQGLVLLAGLGTSVAAALVNSGDWMPFYRLVTPLLALFALAAGLGFARVARRPGLGQQRAIAVALLLCALAAYGYRFAVVGSNGFFAATPWAKGVCYERSAQALEPYLSGQALVAPEAVGAVGYVLPDVPIFDFFGLTEPYIATHGVLPIETYNLGKHHYAYTMERAPDVFLFHSALSNHIPLLNRWGYSQRYRTYELSSTECSLLVGLKTTRIAALLPPLQATFTVRPLETADIPPSPAATWPEGLR